MKRFIDYERGAFNEAKKLIVTVFGFSLLFIGILMLVLPGPGILTALAALVILGTEFFWARELLRKTKEELKIVKKKVLKR